VGGDSPWQLIGRDQDVKFICGFVDDAAVGGGALLVSGDAGVGKTALLNVAALHAEAAKTRVVRAVGAEFESFFDRAGPPGYEIEPLDRTAAASLLKQRFPALPSPCPRRYSRAAARLRPGHP